MSLSGGQSKDKSTQNASTVWGPQGNYLQNMYGQAQDVYNQSQGNGYGEWGNQQAIGLGVDQHLGARQALGPQWLGGANSAMQGAMQGMQNAGQFLDPAQATANRMQNPGTDPQLAMYANQVGQNFREQVMPALQGQAMTAGGYGGSRAGIAQGLAGARAGQQIQDFGAQVYNQNQDRALQAAQMQYGQYGDAMNRGLQAGQLGAGIQQGGMQGANQAQAGALNTAQFGQSMPWYNVSQFAGLLGGPTVLGQGGQSKGSSWNASGGF